MNEIEAIILARVSTEEQREEGHSIPAQLSKARQYCLRKNFPIRSEHQFDESSLKDVRVKFEKILAEIHVADAKIALIVETIDRLQRSFKESVMLDQLRKEGRLEVHFLRENLIIHKNSNSSEIQRWDLGVFLAKSYVLQITDNVNRSIEYKLKNGEYPGRPPLGYCCTRTTDDKSVVEPHPTKSIVARKIFEWYASGSYSITLIKEKVEEEFNLKLHRSRIETVLKNPFYYGEMRYREQTYPHKHPTLISKQIFDQAQDVLTGRNKQPGKFKGLPFLYRGLIRCGHCGCAITPFKKTKKSGRTYVYYHCSEYLGKHNAPYIREEDLTEQFAKYFEQIHIPENIVESVMATLRSSQHAKKEYFETVHKGLTSEYERLETRIDRMYEDKLDGVISNEEFKARCAKYRNEQKTIEEKLKNLRQTDEEYFLNANYLLNLANKAPEIFKSSKVEVKRQLIKLVLWNPTIRDVTLSASIRKPFSLFAEGQGVRFGSPNRI